MTFTITLTESQIYLTTTILLLVLQIYQQHKLSKTQKEIQRIWEVLWLMMGAKTMQQPQQQINQNENQN
jgi:hypothetical protein